MKKVFLLFFCLPFQTFAQKSEINNQVSLSVPIIWNNTTIFNIYSGARAKNISGTAISYGININYSKNIFKDIFLKAGIGYFNQNFGIIRPFYFNGDTSTKVQYNTKRYTYGNINWLIGVGYTLHMGKYLLTTSAVFNELYSIRQTYIPTGHSVGSPFRNYQIETNSFLFGQFLNLNAGAYKKISKKVSIGADLVVTTYTKWRKDKIFAEDESEFYSSKFCIGTNLSFIYNLPH
ncbi:MAG: hypothetical protein M3004_13905 [Bacteroidota bacterium]|nr:hypothetical protein [Bacteroidota bacterium]